MEFEYDGAKSAAKKSKHGIDFEEAEQLWEDSTLVEIPARVTARAALVGRRQDRREALVGSHRAPRGEHSPDLGQTITG